MLPVTTMCCRLAAAASGHGAPDDPLSRTLACAPGGPHQRTEVCQAVPDGELCGGGLDQFAGLDLARDDWPVTDLDPGAEVVFTYRTTITHLGSFRLYVTVDGYDPTEPPAGSKLTSTSRSSRNGEDSVAGRS